MKTLVSLLILAFTPAISFVHPFNNVEPIKSVETDASAYCRIQFTEIYCEETETYGSGPDYIYINVSVDGDRKYRLLSNDLHIRKGETHSLRGSSTISLRSKVEVNLYDHDTMPLDSDDYLGTDTATCSGDGVLFFNRDGAKYRVRYKRVY